MAEDWLADVRVHDAGADESVVAAIIRYCGIALRTENASKVTFADPTETGRVRDNFLKKKLGLTQDDASLDAAIAKVGEAMGSPEEGNRVTVYYLLTKHFDLLETFGGTKGTGATATAAAGATAAAASASAGSAATADTPATSAAAAANDSTVSSFASTGGGSGTAAPAGSDSKDDEGGDDMFGIGCIAGLVAFGAIFFAALVSVWASKTILTSDEVAAETVAAAPAATEPAPEPEPTAEPTPDIPEGAGVTATERDGKPLLTVYFDSGRSEVAPNFEEVSEEIRSYLDDNPEATVQISGFNDPTGNAEINARLSRERAENVQAALVALGLDESRTDLVKPDDTTREELSNAEARRVEIAIVEE